MGSLPAGTWDWYTGWERPWGSFRSDPGTEAGKKDTAKAAAALLLQYPFCVCEKCKKIQILLDLFVGFCYIDGVGNDYLNGKFKMYKYFEL